MTASSHAFTNESHNHLQEKDEEASREYAGSYSQDTCYTPTDLTVSSREPSGSGFSAEGSLAGPHRGYRHNSDDSASTLAHMSPGAPDGEAAGATTEAAGGSLPRQHGNISGNAQMHTHRVEVSQSMIFMASSFASCKEFLIVVWRLMVHMSTSDRRFNVQNVKSSISSIAA